MSTLLSEEDRQTLDHVIDTAEESSGLEFSVLLVDKPGVDPRKKAESIFTRLELTAKPSVMIYVNTSDRVIEVLTSSDVVERLSDVDCHEAVQLMTGLFSVDDLAGGLIRGVEYLSERAGVGESSGPDLPNVIDSNDVPSNDK